MMLRACAALLSILAGVAPAQVDLAAKPYDSVRFGAVPEFEFIERSGAVVTRAELMGEPWVAALFFTSCAGPCPRLSADMRRFLQEPLADTGVKLVSITVDPTYDTPERLAEYARTYSADADRWLFLTGAEDAIHAFAMGGLKLPVAKPEAPADGSISDSQRLAERLQVTHATRLVAVDAEGLIAGYYECGGEAGLAPGEVEASFGRLLARVRALDGVRPSSRLPLVNASLNGLAGVLLVLGLIAIKRGREELHARLMRAAFLASALFLGCYLYYHFVVLPASGGPTPYNGTGWRRTAYLGMLLSHILLAAINLPMVLLTLWRAHKGDWVGHKRLAKRTYPIWLYVSVTGVLVYTVLYHWNPAPA
jgi:protein SCO1/2